MEGQTSNEKRIQPLINQEEAKELALGIARLVEATGEPPKKTLVDSEELARQVDVDFTCFLCRKRCRTKSRFLTHFRSHFKAAQLGRKKRRSNETKLSDVTSDDEYSDDEDDDDDVVSTNNDSAEPVHLRGVENDEFQKSNLQPPQRRKRKFSRVVKKSGLVGSADPDADSGCHSIDDGSSSYSALSDCPGDSESSDSDAGESLTSRPKKVASKKRTVSITVRDRLSLAEKQLDNNETEGLICLTCLKRFSNCQNLRRHLRLHIARDSVTPDIAKAAAGGSLNGGDDDDDFDGRYFCDWCPARFDNRSAARVHENTHKGQATKCYVCDKSYADRYSLRYHLRTHGIGRQIRCEYCNKSFSKPSRLEAHIRAQHDNIRDFDCLQCGKKFKSREHLRNHLTRHSGERPFACDVCSDRFRHKTSLLTHMRSHQGSRPYCCETCGKTFREPSTLKAHHRVHSGDKPYRCNLCDKSFTQRAGLNYHKKSHDVTSDKLAVSTATLLPTPLPSPPVQSGDAVFQMSPLPSFDHLKSISPSSSPSSSSSSSCSSDAFSYSMDKQVVTSSNLHRDVTPPQTPPSMTTSPPMSTTASMSNPYSLLTIDEEDDDDMLPALNISEITHQLDYTGEEQHYYGKNYDAEQAGIQNYRHQMCQQQQHLMHQHHQQQPWFQTPYHIQHSMQQQQQQHQQQPSTSPYTSSNYDYSNHGYGAAEFSNAAPGYSLINSGIHHSQQIHQQQQGLDHYVGYTGNGYSGNYDPQSTVSSSLPHHHHQSGSTAGYCL